MAATLQEILLAPDTKPHVVEDCYALIQEELAEKSGISGTALKLAYKAATTFAPGHVRNMVEKLLPRMVEELEPFWTDFNAAGGTEFGDYLAKRGDEARERPTAGPRRPRRPSGEPPRRGARARKMNVSLVFKEQHQAHIHLPRTGRLGAAARQRGAAGPSDRPWGRSRA